VKIWDTSTWTVVKSLTGHTDRVTSVAFDAKGAFLATGSWDGTAKVWNTATWQEDAEYSLTPKGDLKVSDYVVYQWDKDGKYHQLEKQK